MFKYELHCHTGDVSLCASLSPEDLVQRYRDAGYDGLVLTNHFSPMTFWRTGMVPTKAEARRYLSAYHRAKAAAGEDFTVLLGVELRHYATVNDYLLFGVEEDWLLKQGNMLLWSEKKMSEEAHRAGYLFYQAHPFRKFITRADPGRIDGIEVYNGHTDAAVNALAVDWAKRTGKPVTSGSDTHTPEDTIAGGIVTKRKIRSNADLLDVLRSGDYTLLPDGLPSKL